MFSSKISRTKQMKQFEYWRKARFFKYYFKAQNMFRFIGKNVNKITRSSHQEVFLGKGVLKIWSKFTGEHPCRSVLSIKLICNFIENTLLHGCSSVNLLRISRTRFTRTPLGRLLPNYGKISKPTIRNKLPRTCFKIYSYLYVQVRS